MLQCNSNRFYAAVQKGEVSNGVCAIAEELAIDIEGAGSTTFRRQDRPR
jgi:hypothetical protein